MSQIDVRSRPEGTPSGFTHADAEHLVARLRTTYAGRRTRSIEWRQQQLSALLRMIKEREKELVAALVEDLGRAPFEAWAADLWSTGREIEDMLRNLGSWMKPERRKVPALYRPGRAQIVREPLGSYWLSRRGTTRCSSSSLPWPLHLPRGTPWSASRLRSPRPLRPHSRASCRSTSIPMRSQSSRVASRRRPRCSTSGGTTSSTRATAPSAGSSQRQRRSTSPR